MSDRRRVLVGAGAMAIATMMPAGAVTAGRRSGRLIAIGGAEERGADSEILQRFIELSGGSGARIVVLTAASIDPMAAGKAYRRAFEALGVENPGIVDARDRQQADDQDAATRLREADGIFITGGDQRRLMASIESSAFADAMREAYVKNGACIAGTSAGAAALSGNMLAEGSTPALPEKDAARLDRGLGLVSRAIIDQHFSERRRLGRLLSVVAEQPTLLGLGIDEDTGLVIEHGRGIEVIGRGVVTLLDGRQMTSNIDEIEPRDRLEMLGVRLHLLPAGHRYLFAEGQGAEGKLPPSLRQAVGLLVNDGDGVY
ncbi:cyanophycinase [Piscinibacter sakaiensis]|uniref:cyanophycinase n=1 Tax=Piscinibacter sakaiensis TaxID=1547922 RepID=UPI003AAF1F48